jgi:hypothetical protein
MQNLGSDYKETAVACQAGPILKKEGLGVMRISDVWVGFCGGSGGLF